MRAAARVPGGPPAAAPVDAAADAAADAPDGALVERVLSGDREAFSALARRHQEALFRYARGMGIDRDTAADLVQDALVKAYTRLAQCRDREHFRAWLFRVFRNLLLDHARDVRRRVVPLDAVRERAAPEAGEAELRAALAGALAALPPTLREAFLLKHQQEYSYEEMAEILDASVSALKMRVHRAREALRESFLLM
jgi:RNA polymerase sigma-70 factor, ECF subfamily